MGIRMDQFVGLPSEAEAFLAEHEVPLKICPECKRPLPRNLQVIGCYWGMFDQEYPLHRHVLSGGRFADEFLQETPWDSGPMFFLGLQITDPESLAGPRFEWTGEKINRILGYGEYELHEH